MILYRAFLVVDWLITWNCDFPILSLIFYSICMGECHTQAAAPPKLAWLSYSILMWFHDLTWFSWVLYLLLDLMENTGAQGVWGASGTCCSISRQELLNHMNWCSHKDETLMNHPLWWCLLSACDALWFEWQLSVGSQSLLSRRRTWRLIIKNLPLFLCSLHFTAVLFRSTAL